MEGEVDLVADVTVHGPGEGQIVARLHRGRCGLKGREGTVPQQVIVRAVTRSVTRSVARSVAGGEFEAGRTVGIHMEKGPEDVVEDLQGRFVAVLTVPGERIDGQVPSVGNAVVVIHRERDVAVIVLHGVPPAGEISCALSAPIFNGVARFAVVQPSGVPHRHVGGRPANFDQSEDLLARCIGVRDVVNEDLPVDAARVQCRTVQMGEVHRICRVPKHREIVVSPFADAHGVIRNAVPPGVLPNRQICGLKVPHAEVEMAA